MERTVALVNEWAAFAAKHPNASIEDFCRYYLIHKRERENQGELVAGILPPRQDVLLTKIMDRISKLLILYADSAIEGVGLKHFEEFYFLNAAFALHEPRKTEVIYATLYELSTGIDIINRLKKRDLLMEVDDPDDKRSKRIRITPAGKRVLFACYEKLTQLNDIFFHEMAEDDILLCIQLLKHIEIKFTALWPQHKGKPFPEVYESVVGRKPERSNEVDSLGIK
jgi:DNA-binding MarR family transcriptional regulator